MRNEHEAVTALRDLLPLAEAYLRAAPSHPDNAILETARAIIAREDDKRR